MIPSEIGRAQVWTPVTQAHLVCRLMIANTKLTHQRASDKTLHKYNRYFCSNILTTPMSNRTSTSVPSTTCLRTRVDRDKINRRHRPDARHVQRGIANAFAGAAPANQQPRRGAVSLAGQ